MTEERMVRIQFEDGKNIAMIGCSPMDPIWIRKEDTEPAPPDDWEYYYYLGTVFEATHGPFDKVDDSNEK